MILVADCSALIALSVCDSLDLLEHLFDSVVVPGTVYIEATRPDKKEALRRLKPLVRQVDMQHIFFWMRLPMRVKQRRCYSINKFQPISC